MAYVDYDLKYNELLLEELKSANGFKTTLYFIKRRGVRLYSGNNDVLFSIIKILLDKFNKERKLDTEVSDDIFHFKDMLKNEKLIIQGTEPIPSMTLWEAMLEYSFFDFLEFLKDKNDEN